MTQTDGRFYFPLFRRLASGLAVIAGLALGGCTSTPEDTAPVGFAERGANTGTFPNLNIPQHAAAPQLTNEETEAKLARLRSLERTQSPGSAVETAEERRKRLKLVGEDQAETLKVIEQN